MRKHSEENQHMCEALYELFADELKEREQKGREEGREETVKCLIETCEELGVSRKETTEKLVGKLALPEETAEKYMQKYWKVCV